MFGPWNRRSRVPADLGTVTTIAHKRELHARELGVDPAGVRRIWEAVERLYRTGLHPAIQLCVRRHGAIVLDRTIGHASGNGPDDGPDVERRLATPETPFNIFSASKAVTGMVIHWLDQEDKLRLDDPVVEYIPEFAAHGKDKITIRHLLSHRAGIPSLAPEAMRLETLADRATLVRVLADTKPTSAPGRLLAYHALSGGFVLGEIVWRITGKDLRTVLEESILQPLKFRWMRYGVRPRDVAKVAVNYYTGPPQLPLIPLALSRALGVTPIDAVAMSNDPRFLTGIVPAGNVVTTANEMSRFYELLRQGGELDGKRIFDRRTIRRATTEESYLELDLMIGLPIRYALGFMLGGRWLSLYGPDTEHAFGHLGFTNVVCWADPARHLTAALMTSGKPLIYPEILYVHEILRQIGLACRQG